MSDEAPDVDNVIEMTFGKRLDSVEVMEMALRDARSGKLTNVIIVGEDEHGRSTYFMANQRCETGVYNLEYAKGRIMGFANQDLVHESELEDGA